MKVYLDMGAGGVWLDNWIELWEAMFTVLNYAMYVKANGECKCKCPYDYCTYCPHECF